jgi:hypothetical protein
MQTDAENGTRTRASGRMAIRIYCKGNLREDTSGSLYGKGTAAARRMPLPSLALRALFLQAQRNGVRVLLLLGAASHAITQ